MSVCSGVVTAAEVDDCSRVDEVHVVAEVSGRLFAVNTHRYLHVRATRCTVQDDIRRSGHSKKHFQDKKF